MARHVQVKAATATLRWQRWQAHTAMCTACRVEAPGCHEGWWLLATWAGFVLRWVPVRPRRW